MEENKTGVWLQNKDGVQKECNFEFTLRLGDDVEIYTSAKSIRTTVVKTGICDGRIVYKLIPLCELSNTGKDSEILTCLDLVDMKFSEFLGVVFSRDIMTYTKCSYVSAENMKVVLIPKFIPINVEEKVFGKSQENDKKVILYEESATGKTYPLQTMNEKSKIHTCTIPADKIQVDPLNISVPQSNHLEPMTATSEEEKNWNREYYGIFGAQRGSRLQRPIYDGWADDAVDKMSKYAMITAIPGEEIIKRHKEKAMYTNKLKNKIKKVIYVDKEMTVKEPVLDGNGKQLEENGKPVTKDKLYRGMVKVLWNCGSETVAYTSVHDTFNKEEGFKTCVLKYLFGNAGAHDAVDFWTNKYVKYPSSCVEVTENLCKLEEILENDKKREEERKGLPHAKFFRRDKSKCNPVMFSRSNDIKYCYGGNDSKLVIEFKKLAKKHFPELKGKEIYINDNKNDEIFVAIK